MITSAEDRRQVPGRLLWSGTDARRIPFDTLPVRYIVKANHGSGMVVRVDGPSIGRRSSSKSLMDANRLWSHGHEHHYTAIPRRIVIEEFLDDGCALGPLNYSFSSFHGKPAVIQVDNRDQELVPLLDIDSNQPPLTTRRNKPDVDIGKPTHLAEMLDIARTLSKGFNSSASTLHHGLTRLLR